MIGGGGAGGFYESGGGGAGACIVAIGHTLPSGVCNVIVGTGALSFSANGRDSSISIGGTTLYLAKGGGASDTSGGCGGGAGIGYNGRTISGGDFVSTNIVNGVSNIGRTMQPTYAVFGNKGGDQEDSTSNNSAKSCPGGGGIGAAGENHVLGNLASTPGGAGLNEATINGITYNFKSYFANNNTFGDISGYIGGGGSGIARFNSTQVAGGIGGGGMGAANNSNFPATPGAANTGSGGGGGQAFGRGNVSGGSGIVIIRYRTIIDKTIETDNTCSKTDCPV